jgi:hypothetical protein
MVYSGQTLGQTPETECAILQTWSSRKRAKSGAMVRKQWTVVARCQTEPLKPVTREAPDAPRNAKNRCSERGKLEAKRKPPVIHRTTGGQGGGVLGKCQDLADTKYYLTIGWLASEQQENTKMNKHELCT